MNTGARDFPVAGVCERKETVLNVENGIQFTKVAVIVVLAFVESMEIFDL